ncbi:VOC family protein [Streptomyces sp. CAU 1734]|uniref:VOC family protein n=1 Tax=Streptomyces sp. CAU 1734 TaxID=3140360 RepID=UPI003260E908
MEWTVELIVVPVTDVDRAKDFYVDRCGFTLDHDTPVGGQGRAVQITPPGSRCSLAFGSGFPPLPGQPEMTPGSLHGLQLCVPDIRAARSGLAARGVEVTPLHHLGPEGWAEGYRDEPWSSFFAFTDPDGNGWYVQEAPAPLAER